MSSTWCLLVDFHSVFNSKCMHQCSLNYNVVKLKKIKTKVHSLLHASFPGLCICHCKDRAVCYCMLINRFLFAALYSCWVAVICERPVSALGTAGLRNQLGVTVSWFISSPGSATTSGQRLPSSVKTSLQQWRGEIQRRACATGRFETEQGSGSKCVKEALDMEQKLHWLVSHPFVVWVNSHPQTTVLQINTSLLSGGICRVREILLLPLVHRESEPSFLHPVLPPLLPLGTYLKSFCPWLRHPGGLDELIVILSY